MRALDSHTSFGSTVGHLVRALHKIAALNSDAENSRTLYRGLRGVLPGTFWIPDGFDIVCVTDTAFMSTSVEEKTAIEYISKIDAARDLAANGVLWEEISPRLPPSPFLSLHLPSFPYVHAGAVGGARKCRGRRGTARWRRRLAPLAVHHREGGALPPLPLTYLTPASDEDAADPAPDNHSALFGQPLAGLSWCGSIRSLVSG